MTKLEKALKKAVSFDVPNLKVAQKTALKRNLLAKIQSSKEVEQDLAYLPADLTGLACQITAVSRKVRIPAEVSLLRERILDVIENTKPAFAFGRYFRVVLSGTLLAGFMATSFFLIPFQMQTGLAKGTYLSAVTGDVYVLRDSNLIQGKQYLALQEGDVVMTKDNGFADIHYFNDSVTRLSDNTSLQLKRLYTEPLNPTVSRIDLYMNEGHMWSKVFNLVGQDSGFTVDTGKFIAKVNKKAAFDLTNQGQSTTVAVYDNVVDLSTNLDAKNSSKVVVAGYKADLNSDTATLELNPVTTKNDTKSDTAWLQNNLNSDQDYGDKLIADKVDSIKTDDDSNNPDLGATADLKQNADIDAAKTKFLAAYLELKKGETMSVRGFKKQAQDSFASFKGSVQVIMDQMPTFEAEDQFNADLLRGLMQQRIELQLKDLAAFLPGDILYDTKEVLQQAQVLVAATVVDKIQVVLSQSEDKLLEMQDLIKAGKTDIAQVLLSRYQDQMNQFVVKISSDNYDQIKDSLDDLIGQQIQQIKVLTAIEGSLSTDSVFDLREQVRQVRQDTLFKLLDALQKLNGSISKQLLDELKDVIDSYLKGSNVIDNKVSAAFDLLVKNYKEPNPKSDVKVPQNLGVLTIITQSGTPDVSNQIDDSVHGAASSSNSVQSQQTQN